MSRVFVAQEKALGRTVVVKVLREELAAGMNRERFRREVTLAAQLHHPHIVPLLNAGEQGELLWYTMPFVEGESLRDAIRNGHEFKTRDIIRLLHDMLDALAYAHSRGVVHRDIKPGNILRHGNHSLVTDFGVAKALSAARPSSGTTSAGMAIGTPAYMAPEQLAADPKADHRLDLYAAGLVAYEAITHQQPFAAASPQETLAAQMTRMPTPLREVRPDVPVPLASLITRLLAKNPAERPQSAAAAIEELDSFTTPVEISAELPATGSRWKVYAPVLGAALVLASVWIADSIAARNSFVSGAARPDTVARAPSGATTKITDNKTAKAPPPRRDSAKTKTSTKTPPTTTVGKAPDAKAPRAPGEAAAFAKQAAAMAQSIAANRPSKPTATPTPPPAPTGPPKRVAVLPVRVNGQSSDSLTAASRALRDSISRAVIAAGYVVASDAEVLDLVSAGGSNDAMRQTALNQKVGALVIVEVQVSGDELQLQPQVRDTWRNQLLSERLMVDRGKPAEIMSAVRSVTHSLDRVAWRTPTDAKGAIVFVTDNYAGDDTANTTLTRAIEDSIRSVISKRLGWKLLGDSTTRLLRDPQERRAAGVRLGAGALVAALVTRQRGDSMSLRISIRDMSEENIVPYPDTRFARAEFSTQIAAVMDRLATQLGLVNWGPKRQQGNR